MKFLIDGKTHYGWVRLTVTTTGKITGTITAYAYETVANKKVLAGVNEAPVAAEARSERLTRPSLGMLAAGVEGVTLWRKKKEEPAIKELAI